MSNPLAGLGGFVDGVREELKQVTWPTREEVFGSVLVVFVGVALMAVFIGIIDVLFSGAARLLFK